MGAEYGGLLSDCENEVGCGVDDNTIYPNIKEWLFRKSKSFTNKTKAQKSCLFFTNFLEADGNPFHYFKDIECPSVLKDKY